MQHPPAFFHAGPLRQGAREPAQASLTLRPVGLLSRLKRPLSRGFSPSGYPAEPLVSYQINRQLSGWNLPPLVIRAFGAHCHFRTSRPLFIADLRATADRGPLRPTVAARRIHRNRPGSWLRARVLVPERRLSGVRHLDPLLVGRCVCDVAVVPVPPLVGRGLRIALGPA